MAAFIHPLFGDSITVTSDLTVNSAVIALDQMTVNAPTWAECWYYVGTDTATGSSSNIHRVYYNPQCLQYGSQQASGAAAQQAQSNLQLGMGYLRQQPRELTPELFRELHEQLWMEYRQEQPPELTPEEQAAQVAAAEVRQLEWERQQAEQLRARERARTRATRLLTSLLDPSQVASLRERDYFELDIDGRDGAVRRYRIKRGRAGNVELLGAGGQPVRRYCIHPEENVPDEDTMAIQRLMLQHDEEHFLRIANMTLLRGA